MKKILILLALLVATNAASEATTGDLMGLGMAPELASRVSVLGQTMLISEDANRKIAFAASSDTALTMKFGDGSTAAQTFAISSADADASDDSEAHFTAGGAVASDGSRGAGIYAYGNEHATNFGKLELIAGNAAGDGRIQVITKAASAINFLTANTQRLGISGTGVATFTGTVLSTNATDIGWTAATGLTNATCNTQCTNACVIGMDTDGAKTTFVACNAATAENCLCAGAS